MIIESCISCESCKDRFEGLPELNRGKAFTAVCINVDTFGRSRQSCKPSVGLALNAEQASSTARSLAL